MLLISNKFDKLVIRFASFNHSMRYKREKKRKNVLFFFFNCFTNRRAIQTTIYCSTEAKDNKRKVIRRVESRKNRKC